MAHLRDPAAASSGVGLRAITINGSIQVESEEDIAKRREKRRKERKSRWGKPANGVDDSAGVPAKRSSILLPEDAGGGLGRPAIGMASSSSSATLTLPTMIDASSMDEKGQQIYLCQMQIQEATVRLGRADLGIPVDPRDRSPSPEPIYNNRGVRINTREDRTRNKLINQRNAAVTKLKTLDPTYQPPSSYKYKNALLEDRVPIPADEYPHINFMGLLLGPRGNFLEELKAKTKCNIVIRGRGSLKTGMTGITKDGKKYDALDEPMHAFITAATAEDVKRGAKEIQELIDMQVYNPDSEKAVALRSKHMHELAVLNGTLKDVDIKCLNCGRMGHKTWQCDESSVFTASVICNACGGIGHVTADCKQRRPGQAFNRKAEANPEEIDAEYDAFLADMGVDVKKKKDGKKEEEKYVPPMGDLSKALRPSTSAPLMLTNGSAAPGAASAHERAVSSGQQHAGGSLQVMGKSIFGGKLTRLTSGFKSHSELEHERRKKREEAEAGRPVPLEWQVARYEQGMEKRQDAYLKQLEAQAAEARRAKERGMLECLAKAPPPPPPGSGPGPTSSGSSAAGGLPNLVGTPFAGFRPQ